MTREKTQDAERPRTLVINDPELMKGTLKAIGGSQSDDWNSMLIQQALGAIWNGDADIEAQEQRVTATLAAMAGIAPRDELEGMLAVQMIGIHNASMECMRRAMLPNQKFEGWRESLNQANKLSRTYATLLDALNKHRGKGQQKVTVEHVHVHNGGQAIVGAVAKGGGGNGGT